MGDTLLLLVMLFSGHMQQVLKKAKYVNYFLLAGLLT